MPDDSDSKLPSADSEATLVEEPSPRRLETINVGGVASTRTLDDRTIAPASIRKHAYLTIASGSKKYREVILDGDVTVIGRGPEADFALDEPAASRKHAIITRTREGHCLRDLGSTNGTWLKGVLKDAERFLEDDDCFRIGGTEFVYHAARRSDA